MPNMGYVDHCRDIDINFLGRTINIEDTKNKDGVSVTKCSHIKQLQADKLKSSRSLLFICNIFAPILSYEVFDYPLLGSTYLVSLWTIYCPKQSYVPLAPHLHLDSSQASETSFLNKATQSLIKVYSRIPRL